MTIVMMHYLIEYVAVEHLPGERVFGPGCGVASRGGVGSGGVSLYVNVVHLQVNKYLIWKKHKKDYHHKPNSNRRFGLQNEQNAYKITKIQ